MENIFTTHVLWGLESKQKYAIGLYKYFCKRSRFVQTLRLSDHFGGKYERLQQTT